MLLNMNRKTYFNLLTYFSLANVPIDILNNPTKQMKNRWMKLSLVIYSCRLFVQRVWQRQLGVMHEFGRLESLWHDVSIISRWGIVIVHRTWASSCVWDPRRCCLRCRVDFWLHFWSVNLISGPTTGQRLKLQGNVEEGGHFRWGWVVMGPSSRLLP